MDLFMLFMVLGFGFFAYLLYSRQFGWFLSVIRNMVVGVGAILAANFVLYGVGIIVGINAVTALVVGLLGLPGFLLLYATRLLVG